MPDDVLAPQVSTEVVADVLVPGESGPPPLAKELLLGGRDWTSLSQEERRPGFGLDEGVSCACLSGSSSEEATTSESGVERLAMKRLFSSSIGPLLAVIPAIEARDDGKG